MVVGTTGRENAVACPLSDFHGPSGAHRMPPQLWRYARCRDPISGQSDSRGTLRREEKTTLPWDCGVFAIAIATTLANNRDLPLAFDQPFNETTFN